MANDYKRYEFTDETKVFEGRTLHRIRCVNKIATPGGFGLVCPGYLGGWVENEFNLSQEKGDMSWVYGDAIVCDNAYVDGSAMIMGASRVSGDAHVYGDSRVFDNAVISGHACVHDNAIIGGTALVTGRAHVCDHAVVSCSARIYDDALIDCYARVYGHAMIADRAKVSGKASVEGNVTIGGRAELHWEPHITGSATICGDAYVCRNSHVLSIGPLSKSSTDYVTFFRNKEGIIKVYHRSTRFVGTPREYLAKVSELYKYDTRLIQEHCLAVSLAMACIDTEPIK